MKMRNKGKVHPSPFASSSSSISPSKDALSVLKLLPAAILVLASVLSPDDREVLAYMITRSMKTTNPSGFVEEKKKNPRKLNAHKPPMFDCECFDCYRSFWFRWDSSPNRELIHQAIEAFEEHLSHGEQLKKSRNKKKEKMAGRRGLDTSATAADFPAQEKNQASSFLLLPEDVISCPEVADVASENGGCDEGEAERVPEPQIATAPEVLPETQMASPGPAANNHKGLVRKVLPDVLGLLNSRLWSLWGPNV